MAQTPEWDRRLWVADQYALRCCSCEALFNIVRRRHHCRQCGQIFCSNCLIVPSTTLPRNAITTVVSSLIGLQREPSTKMCHECHRILQQRNLGWRNGSNVFTHQEVRRRSSLKPPLASSREIRGSTRTSPTIDVSSPIKSQCLDASVGVLGFSRADMSDHQLVSSMSLSSLIQSSFPRLRNHTESSKEREITYGIAEIPLYSRNSMSDWLTNLLENSQKASLGEVHSKLEDTCCARVFAPYPRASFVAIKCIEANGVFATSFLSPSAQGSLLQLERESTFHLIKRTSRMFVREMAALNVIENITKTTDSYEDNKRTWVTQWIANICDLSWRIVSQTAMTLHEHIAEHFDIICIPGGQFVDTEVISGVAFTQTVASKRMKTLVHSPSILLLSGDVGTSLKPEADLLEYLDGYEGYLEKLYQRIDLWNPSVIAVEGSMHHYLQKRIMHDSRATLILHCGHNVVKRLSHCCNASIVDNLQYVSPADLRNPLVLGSCEIFQMTHVGGKALCLFKGPRRPVFTTVILRGDVRERLEVLKRVLINSVVTAYHLTLQAHLVSDLCITLRVPDTNPIVTSSSCSVGDNVEDDLGEFLQFILQSPREEDRAETLSMNFGVVFPDEVKLMDDQYDDLMWDNIVVNTVFLDGVSGFGVEDGTGTPVGTLNCGVRQSREVFPFYSDGDETVLDYLTARVKEGDSLRFITHGHKRLWVRTTTEFGNNISCQARRMESGYSETSSFRSALELDIVASDSRSSKVPRREELEHVFPPLCQASCSECSKNDSGIFSYCSLHMLSLSWGSFLEFCVYGSACFTLSCGHSLDTSLSLLIVFFPDSRREVSVSIVVEPVKTYTIMPLFRSLPPFPDVAKLYFKEEIEELRLVLSEISFAIQAVKAVYTSLSCPPSLSLNSRQQLPSSASQLQSLQSQSPSLQPAFLAVHSSPVDAEPGVNIEDDSDKAFVLLRRVDELMEMLPLLKSSDDATAMRLDHLVSLVNDFMEWHIAVMSGIEQRTGKRPAPVDMSKFNELNWACDILNKFSLRLHEPTSLVAVALQATSMGGCATESSSNDQRSTRSSAAQRVKQEQEQSETSRERTPTPPDDDDGFPLNTESSPLSLEDTMKVVFGVEPQTQPSWSSPSSPPSSFIRSTSEAMDILWGRRTSTTQKATLKHTMEVWVPFDKSDQVTVTVEVMFPHQFAALRYLYAEGKDFDFIQSLRRCRPFKPQGGRTNSDFFITRDERFVMKQLKQAELRHFVQFGPSYFTYLAHMYNRGQNVSPADNNTMAFGSCLGKIFGVFSLHIKRNKKFMDRRSEIRYFALIENVFYSRCADVIYDLKGSQRNRTAPGGSSVLLDQDLVSSLQKGFFFYCTNDEKSFLMDSLTNDTHLLSSSSIMDYSLIVALNKEKGELYLGVVDYLHPYTGAKVIESKVKAGLETVLGHPGRDPTIIDPSNYRVRFTKWMDSCFCGVPEKTFAVKRAVAKRNRRGES